MTKITFIILLLIFSATLVYSAGKPTKYALIVAVADYPAEGGWKPISSLNDVDLIRDALLKQGFNENDIKVITNSEAKKADIVNELGVLTKKVKKGDVVVVHFSGHGQQIADNQAKDEIDGYDESIIPFDANLYYSSTYNGENHLRDDEITVLLDGIREKLGEEGDILVILDSCHSGTATRGLAPSRGTSVKFEEPGYVPPKTENQEISTEIDRSTNTNVLASMVVISGASQEELNYEYLDKNSHIRYGSLSFAISKALAEAKPETTYAALFDKIKVEMSMIAPKQSPQIEGDVNNKIFGGKAVDQKPYYTISDWFDDKTVTIKAGNLMGLYDGTRVGFYDINTANPKDTVAKTMGTIANASSVEADIILDTPLSKIDAKNSWIFITKQNFGNNTVNVKIKELHDKELKNLLVKECEKIATINIVDENPELIIELASSPGSNALQIITVDELKIYESEPEGKNNAEVVKGITERLRSYFQANLLKSIDMQEPELNVSFEIIPVSLRRSGSRYVVNERMTMASKMNNANQLEFQDGDAFVIKVKNNGYSKAFYQIIDIQPDNSISILVPSQNRTPAEYVIYPGEEKELGDIIAFGEPFGTEVFKLIATREAIDLSGIITTRGADAKGDKSPFEQLFAESFTQTRANTISVPPSSVNVFTIAFKVVGNDKK